jgi:hypothetical protein
MLPGVSASGKPRCGQLRADAYGKLTGKPGVCMVSPSSA